MAKSQTTKKKLTGSILALVLCFAMLLGTTFAWFTDTASTNVNKIQAGTLDVQLLDKDGNSLEGETLAWQKAAGHENEAVLWEPGATYNLQPVTIKNSGNLALKYKLEITGIEGDAKLNEAIEWATAVETSGNDAATQSITEERSLAPGESDTLTISGHMKETAGNEYQGLEIKDVAITVVATQDTVEADSNGTDYDANATYDPTSLEDINAVINSGSNKLTITGNIKVDVAQNDGWSAIRVDKDKGAADEVILEGTGTVTSDKFVIWARAGATAIVKSGNYVSTGSTHLVYANLGGTVIIEGGTFSGATADHFFNISNGDRGSIIIKGGIYSRDPRTQIASNDVWNGTTGVKIEDGYKVVEKDIDGTTWYQVVTE